MTADLELGSIFGAQCAQFAIEVSQGDCINAEGILRLNRTIVVMQSVAQRQTNDLCAQITLNVLQLVGIDLKLLARTQFA